MPPNLVSAETWQRFKQEAQVISRLAHRNIVQVTDLGIHEKTIPFYAMEFVNGESIEALLERQGKLHVAHVLEIFLQLCDGFDFAHQHGIVHRDIKPGNIMLEPLDNVRVIAKILDFGLVKLVHRDRSMQSLTLKGDVFGSPYYMSPEQCTGQDVDKRSDIYSLGCTMFECLTGRPPFVGNMAAAIMNAHEIAQPPTLESILGHGVCPESLEIVVAKLLRKNPAERYQTMAQLKSDLLLVRAGKNVKPVYMSRSTPEQMPLPDEQDSLSGSKLSPIGRARVSIIIAVTLLALAAAYFSFGRQHLKSLLRTASSIPKPASVPASAPKPTSRPYSTNLTASAAPAPEQPKVAAYVLNAKNSARDVVITCIHDRANFDNGIVTYSIGAPDYHKLTAFNYAGKHYAEMTLDAFCRKYTPSYRFQTLHTEEINKQKIFGCNCTHYRYVGYAAWDPSLLVAGDYYATLDIPVTKELAVAVSAISGAPPGLGIPIKFQFKTYRPAPGQPRLARERAESSKSYGKLHESITACLVLALNKAEVPRNTFVMPPAGATKIKNQVELYSEDFSRTLDMSR